MTPNFILLGDLNLDLNMPDTDRQRVNGKIRQYNAAYFGDPGDNRVYFPFIDKHPVTGKVVRTNARLNQTFDQIAFFRGEKETQLPNHEWRGKIPGKVKDLKPDAYYFDVFNFAELFAQALKSQPYAALSSAQVKSFGRKFENSVSDHMPIWVRIPRPGF